MEGDEASQVDVIVSTWQTTHKLLSLISVSGIRQAHTNYSVLSGGQLTASHLSF